MSDQVAEPRIIREAGIYDDIEEADYHADPCPTPSLSRSVLKQLVDRSPAHAWVIHPKLGGLDEIDDSGDEVMDFGTAAHASFLQGRSNIRMLDFPDWRTNKAKEARELAYADGMIPLLNKSYGRAMRLIEVLENFRSATGAFTLGKPEQTVVWDEGPVWCRARVDWLPDEPGASPWDLKSTAGSAQASVWGRMCFEKGADLQDAFYCRGLEMVRQEPPGSMLFCVVEQKPPHAIAVFEMSRITRDIADQKVLSGISLWENCLASREWPAYPIEPNYIDPPPWVVRDWEARGALSQRSQDLQRERRELPIGVKMVESGNFGG